MDKPQAGDAQKAAAFARAFDTPVACDLCGEPMQGKHQQCANAACLWKGTTRADQDRLGDNPIEDQSDV